MDSSSGTSFMPYDHHSHNDELDQNNLLEGIEQFMPSELAIHPDLLQDSSGTSLATYGQSQPSHQAQNNFNHAIRQTHSQSPGLPQFRPTQHSYPGGHYAQNPYTAQAFEAQFPRATASPGPFDHFAYQGQQMSYSQQQQQYQQQQSQAHDQFNPFYNGFSKQSRPSNVAYQTQNGTQSQQYLNAQRPSTLDAQQQMQQIQHGMNLNGTVNPMQQYAMQNQRYQMPQQTINPSELGGPGVHLAALNQRTASNNYSSKPGTPNSLDPTTVSAASYVQSQQAQALRQAQMQAQQQPQAQNIQAQAVQQPSTVAVKQQVAAPTQIKATSAKTSANEPPKKKLKISSRASDSDSEISIATVESDDEDPQPKPACISITRPVEEKASLRWDIVETVWAPHNKLAPESKIRTAVKTTGDIIRKLRLTWKEANDSLKKAENASLPTAGIREKVQVYREYMDMVVMHIMSFGHPSIVKRLGANQPMVAALGALLIDRAHAEDYDSPLIIHALQLVSRFSELDEELLESTKWTKVLVRFEKKCTNESKALASAILKKAKEGTARKKASSKALSGPASPGGSTAGIKRSREGADGAPPAKKPVKQASKPLSMQIAEKKKAEKAAGLSNGIKVAKPTPAAPNAVATPAARAKTTAAPQPSLFSGLMSASKRPGTSLAERQAKKESDGTKPTALTVPLTAATPLLAKTEASGKTEPAVKPIVTGADSASSFLGFLSAMDKPKETIARKVESDPTETPEAREKRLRKESRRRLRVTWKPESELVETRIFEHDPEEETGHDDSQTRDVGDTANEGEMLKKSRESQDIDSDDSDDEGAEQLPMEFFTPTEIDFSTMNQKPEDDFANMNFVKTGGDLKPESPASKAQDEKEYGKEMTIYRPGEQPSSPKEPLEEEDDDFAPVADFGEPQDGKVRERERQILERRNPPGPSVANGMLANAMSGLQTQLTQGQHNPYLASLNPANTQATPQFDLSQYLAMMQQQQTNNSYQAPAQTQQQATPDLAAFLAQFTGNAANTGQANTYLNQGFGNALPIGDSDNPNPFPGDKKKDKKRSKGGVPLDSAGLPINYKTRVCQFWLQNKCTKGDGCTYRHDREVD